MERSKVDMFMSVNAGKFRPELLPDIRERLEQLSDTMYLGVSSLGFQDPTLMIIIAVLFGWERFFLGDIGLGILKVITCYGLGIWWLVDIFTAQSRTFDYNYRKLITAIAISGGRIY